jgi:hypothetical protein
MSFVRMPKHYWILLKTTIRKIRSKSGMYRKRDQRLRRDPTVNGTAVAIRKRLKEAYHCLLRSFSQEKRPSDRLIRLPEWPLAFVLNLCGAAICPELFQFQNSSTPTILGSPDFSESLSHLSWDFTDTNYMSFTAYWSSSRVIPSRGDSYQCQLLKYSIACWL